MHGRVPPVGANSGLDATGATIDLRALLGVLLRRKYMIAGLAFLGALLTAAYALTLPTRYTATAVVMLNTRTLNVVDFESVLSNLALRPETVDNEIALIRSAVILNRVIDELDLESDPEFNVELREPTQIDLLRRGASAAVRGAIAAAVPALFADDEEGATLSPEAQAAQRRNLVLVALREAVTIEQIELSLSIAVRAISERPAQAARIANAIARTYVDDQLQTKADATEGAALWLADRVSAQRIELEAAETRLRELSSAANLRDPAEMTARGEQLRDLRERARLAEAETLNVEVALERARSALSAGAPREAAEALPTPSAALRRLLSQNGDAATIADLAAKEIDRLAESVQRRRETSTALAQGVERLEREIAEDDAARVRIEQLTSETQAARLVYESLLARLNETANQFGALQADARVVSNAFPPEDPSEPLRTVMVMLGTVLAGMMGCALAFLLDALDRRVHSARILEQRVGLPVLAHLPRMRRERGVSGGLAKIAASPLAVEGAQSLRTAIVLREGGNAPKVVMVTSSRAAEGKSTTCLMLAHAENAVGKSVLLIDADFRRPTLHHAFRGLGGVKADLVSALDGRTSLEESIHVDPESGIAVLPVLRPSAHGTRLVSSDNFRDLIARVRGHFDMVVVDAPPVMLVSDAYVTGKLADATVYAVRWNETPADLVSIGLGKLDQHGIPVLGLVLTFVDFAKARVYDSIEYGSYTVNNPYLAA